MRGMNSASVDLIYLPPPFNSNRTYSPPTGSEAPSAAFKGAWTLDDVDLAWHGEIAERGPPPYAVIDAAGQAHGKGMFRNEMIWKRISNHNDAGWFGRTPDRLLFYGSEIDRDAARAPLAEPNVASKYRYRDDTGKYRRGGLTGAGVSTGEAGTVWKGKDPTNIGKYWSVPRTGAYAEWIEEHCIPGYGP